MKNNFNYGNMVKYNMKKYLLFLIFALQGCNMADQDQIDRFNSKINGLVRDSMLVRIVAAELTDFKWNSLCFEERKGASILTFLMDNKKLVFKFSREDYFLNEPYSLGSLNERCIVETDEIVLKKKYFNDSTIEFSCCMLATDSQLARVQSRVDNLLGNSVSIEIPASQLTDFKWERLCFKNNVFNSLTFEIEGKELVFPLNFNSYQIVFGVKNSLYQKCIVKEDHVLLVKKDLKWKQVVLFLQPENNYKDQS